MAAAVRYRSGVDGRTGQVLVGAPHLAQSLELIWLSKPGDMLMALDFGSDLQARLSEDITPELALAIYGDLVTAVERDEPEYRVQSLQVVSITAAGALGLRHSGLYYPEGRLGNYRVATPFGAVSAIRGTR